MYAQLGTANVSKTASSSRIRTRYTTLGLNNISYRAIFFSSLFVTKIQSPREQLTPEIMLKNLLDGFKMPTMGWGRGTQQAAAATDSSLTGALRASDAQSPAGVVLSSLIPL